MSDVFLTLAVVLITVGAGLFHVGAGLIVGGLCFFGLALLTVPRDMTDEEE